MSFDVECCFRYGSCHLCEGPECLSLNFNGDGALSLYPSQQVPSMRSGKLTIRLGVSFRE